ncbi:carbohydrate-binding domain-containing protein [Metabacillus sp. Hm71]|uniref:carbohydrate-binding domain-containing protein n=1 Tax=Metabacillus sp. Hm71 TaxID=3450743 RepID=UPI003F427240
MNKSMTRFLSLFACLAIITSGCSSNPSSRTNAAELASNLVTYDSDDTYTSWQDSNVTYIRLEETTATVEENDGVIVEESQILIRTTGTYVVEGTLEDGQIVVDAEDAGKVRLILNGAEIHSSTSAPIYVKQADKTVLSLEKDTENTLSDGKEYVYEDGETDEPEAAIFSKDDLTINGSGKLNVTGNFKDGITSRDDLKITGGTIEVTSADDGFVGRDLLAVKDAAISVTATGDGLKASNDEDESKGNIVLESGSVTVQAKGDGIQAEKAVTVIDGEYSIIAGGGSPETIESAEQPMDRPLGTTEDMSTMIEPMLAGIEVSDEIKEQLQNAKSFEEIQTILQNYPEIQEQLQASRALPAGGEPPQMNAEETESEDTFSTKGIKAGTEMTIAGGTFTIDSLEDSLHSDKNLTIAGGKIKVSTGDDGIHGGANVAINGGTIDIEKSLEGIEGVNITVADGSIYVHSEDDGVNVNGGSSDAEMPRMGMNVSAEEETAAAKEETAGEESTEDSQLIIEGGYLYVDANGDGLDSNTAIKQTGGTVLVYGPTSSGNGSLDYTESYMMEGGILVAAGSSGMAQGISEDSTQNAVMMTFSEFQEAGTSVYVADQKGEQIFAIAPEKQYQTILISTPDLQSDQSYTISSGGALSGENKDGLYDSAQYKDGTQPITFTLSDIITYLDESGVTEAPAGRFGGNGGGPKGMEGRNPFNTEQNTDTQTE